MPKRRINRQEIDDAQAALDEAGRRVRELNDELADACSAVKAASARLKRAVRAHAGTARTNGE